MSEQNTSGDQPTVSAARRALELKRAAKRSGGGIPDAGRSSERDAAARSASKSKPALRK